MVDNLCRRYHIVPGPLLMHDFSGGGQFVHRFFYLHPHRLTAVSIGAPGSVTLIDPDRGWWAVTRDLQARFEVEIDAEIMRQVQVQTLIGWQNSGADEVMVLPSSRHSTPHANHAGADRQTRLETLAQNLAHHGVEAEPAIRPGVGHDHNAVLPAAVEFFSRVLKRSDAC